MEGRSAFIVNNNNILKETIEPYRDIKYSQFQHNEVIRGNLNGKILDVYSSWDIASNDEDIALKKQKDLKPINEQNWNAFYSALITIRKGDILKAQPGEKVLMLKVTHGNQIWLIAQIPERYCYAPAIYNRNNNLNRI